MYNVSPHTTQVNCWIALTKSREEFSNTLESVGYSCDFIEKSIRVNGDDSKPDIVLTSSRGNHSLVIECKGDGIDRDQFQRYQLLVQNPQALLESSRFKHDISRGEYHGEVCYSAFSDLSLEPTLREGQSAFVHFQKTTSGIFLSNTLNFKSDILRSAFPINMDPDEDIPVEYYPFDIEQRDDYPEFVSALIQAILRTSIRDGVLDVESVLKEAHPYWDHLGDEKQDRFREEAKKVMKKLEQRELVDFIENIAESDTQWKVHHKTADAIQERLNDPQFVKKVASVIDQSTFSQGS